ncbi:unnamed protein product [Cylicocyclus nassatus]|uniref:Uncharacterized protein n=1 Tax=Cylicocyclus nassatus TaxID=53992 RepID=A0AA36GHB7_CYLNA|nr:unnamed protein product [Cylicocyclus nassatus]
MSAEAEERVVNKELLAKAEEREIDKEYLALLENRLKALKDPKKATAKQFLSDIATYRDQQLFKLITSSIPEHSGFDDDFADIVITPNYLRRVIAPQTCAINKLELVHLVKSDHVQKQHEAAIENDLPLENNDLVFTERKFLSFTESNQIFVVQKNASTSNACVQTCLISAYGRLLFVEENKVVCLPKLLDETLKSGHSIELSCGDISPLEEEGSLAVLATCWVELNEHFCPCRNFGALFRISSTLHVELTSKVEASAPVAHCSIIGRGVDALQQKYWVVYEAGDILAVYRIEQSICKVERVVHPLVVFPELTLDAFPGAVTRSSLISTERLRWSALGFDTGHVFLSVFDADTNIVYRKLIKFSGPISVVQFISCRTLSTPSDEADASESSKTYEERYLAISSTLGPVAVWKCNFEGDFLCWNHEFVLKQSEQYDSITSACMVRESQQSTDDTSACVMNDLIAVATYSGKILFYSLNCDLFSHEISWITQINAPLVKLKVLDENTLYALSTAGLHTVRRNES